MSYSLSLSLSFPYLSHLTRFDCKLKNKHFKIFISILFHYLVTIVFYLIFQFFLNFLIINNYYYTFSILLLYIYYTFSIHLLYFYYTSSNCSHSPSWDLFFISFFSNSRLIMWQFAFLQDFRPTWLDYIETSSFVCSMCFLYAPFIYPKRNPIFENPVLVKNELQVYFPFTQSPSSPTSTELSKHWACNFPPHEAWCMWAYKWKLLFTILLSPLYSFVQSLIW